ncbi:DUF1643 domain-containing protein [Lacticaseibacillus absianus]|uniref:DUF1643 domain-containing protein n=1 Tax=Lacticaseibacillus absianus TaxID=2729623 RepID=UPI0015CE85F3|nr:DUF1643 domain-containing protein [Lacticaseibacillus absianus]
MIKKDNPTLLEEITVTSRSNTQHLFWVRWSWNSLLPQYLVVANYPSVGDPRVLDLTRLLIVNHVRGVKGGGVAIANLFSRPVTNAKDESLVSSATAQGLKEIALMAKEVDQVVLAMGSLPNKSKVAGARLEEMLAVLHHEKLDDKVSWLVNPKTHQPAHPLSLQGQDWQLSPLSPTVATATSKRESSRHKKKEFEYQPEI